MAMNKAERAAFDHAQRQLGEARALGWSQLPQPKPLDGQQIEGWYINKHHREVKPACRVGHLTYLGMTLSRYADLADSGQRPSGTQGGYPLYRTEVEALIALRLELERDFATLLQHVDGQLAVARGQSPASRL